MSLRKKNKRITALDQGEIDRLVISQSEDDSAWEAPAARRLGRRCALRLSGSV